MPYKTYTGFVTAKARGASNSAFTLIERAEHGLEITVLKWERYQMPGHTAKRILMNIFKNAARTAKKLARQYPYARREFNGIARTLGRMGQDAARMADAPEENRSDISDLYSLLKNAYREAQVIQRNEKRNR